MGFDINDLQSNLAGGGARPNKFSIQITNPVNPIADIKVPFLVKASALPGMTLGEIPIGYFGRKIYVAGDRTFEPWDVMVYNDIDFAIRDALETWNGAINSMEGNIDTLGAANPSLYQSIGIVTQYDTAGNTIRQVQFNNIWIKTLGNIQLDWDQTDSIEVFSAQFRYNSWQVIPGGNGSGPPV